MSILKTKPPVKTDRVEKMKTAVSTGKTLRSLHLQIDGRLLRKFKSRTASEGLTMTEIITRLIEDYLRQV